MTELKTLKDFILIIGLNNQKDYLGFRMINSQKLRQEAIKWVKDLTEKQKTSLYNNFAIIEWIKHFFNLTEEDLE